MAILSLLLVSGVIDLVVLKTNFAITSYDNDTGWFSIGLARVSGAPVTDFHQPSFFFNVLAGFFVSLVSLDGTERPLVTYLNLAFAVQLVFTAGASYAIARLVRNGTLPIDGTVVATAVAASMPTTVVFSGHFSNYFVIIVLALLVGLLLSAWLAGNDEALPPVGALLGFMVANFFPMLAVLFTVVLALLVKAVARRLGPAAGPMPAASGCRQHWTLLGLGAATAFAMTYRLPLIAEGSAALVAGATFAATLVAMVPASLCWLGRTVERTTPTVWRFLGWLLIGWWLGALWLAPYYLTSLGWRLAEVYDALFTQGYLLRKLESTPIVWLGLLPFVAVVAAGGLVVRRRGSIAHGRWMTRFIALLALLATIGIVAVFRTKLLTIPWLWLTLLPFAVCGAMVPRLFRGTLEPGRPAYAIAAVVFGLGTPLTLAVALLYGTSHAEPSMAVRLMIGTLVIVVAAVCFAFQAFDLTSSRRLAVGGVVCALCLVSVAGTLQAASQAIQRNATIGNAIEAKISEFLKTNPNGVVLCARDEAYTKTCSTAYAYNSYRPDESRTKLPTKFLFGDKVLWLSIPELSDPLSLHLPNFRGPMLVVGFRDRIIESGNPLLIDGLPDPTAGDFVAYEIAVE